jgi:dihydroflavonol-4-reductase
VVKQGSNTRRPIARDAFFHYDRGMGKSDWEENRPSLRQPPEEEVYLVTGADGFIGREICRQLIEKGCRVRGLLEEKQRGRVPMPVGVALFYGDIRKPESLEPFFEGTQGQKILVIHTAAVISVRKRDAYCERVNVEGTGHILTLAERYHVARFVHFASVDALNPPSDGTKVTDPTVFSPEGLPTSYGRSKAKAAQMVLNSPIKSVVLLPACVVGPGDYRRGFVTQMLGMYLRGLPKISVEGGYEFVDVRDVAAAAVRAAKEEQATGCYLISNAYASVTEVFNLLSRYMGWKSIQKTLPLSVLYPLVPLVEAIWGIAGKEPPLSVPAILLMRTHPAYCHERAEKELGFLPRSMESSIQDAAAFIRDGMER